MRNLSEIIEDCKLNGRPDYEELRYSVLVLTWLLNGDHRRLRETLLSNKLSPEFIRKMQADNSYTAYKSALNKSPKEFIGWEHDPQNPEYQKWYAAGNKLIDKALKGELPNQKNKDEYEIK